MEEGSYPPSSSSDVSTDSDEFEQLYLHALNLGDGTNMSRPPSSFLSMVQRMEADEEPGLPRFISDNVHGSTEVPIVCQVIMDTVQFDRLRSLKQLGCSHYVFPGAKHSRFEHSLGVMHLAGHFLNALMTKRPGCCSKEDRLCVMMAGLCHDLGHGPFSHLWEMFVSDARPGFRWSHESTSLQMLDFIIQENDLMPKFEEHGITEKDIIFIKELIYGPLQQGRDSQGLEDDWPYLGRGKDKFFLYELISNKISSIDVDKWDYMKRDSVAMDIATVFNYQRFIDNSDIIAVDGRMRLCIRDKESENVLNMFMDRSRLHKNGYQHKTVKVVDRMIVDALLLADPHLDILGRNEEGEVIRMSTACDDVRLFSKLSDDFVLRSIQFSTVMMLEQARNLVNRITARKLYKLIGQVINTSGEGQNLIVCEDEMNNIMKDEQKKGVSMNLNKGDIVIVKKIIKFGLVTENPVEKVIFFDKRGRPIPCSLDELQSVIPAVPTSETLLVMCRRDQEDSLAVQEAKELFGIWFDAKFGGNSAFKKR